MKIIKENCNCPGIYVIKNSINNKIYVGKSKNCYKRLHQHLSDIKIDNRNYNENPYLLNAFKKYGFDNFEYYLVEKFDINDKNLENILAEKELYWMKELDSLNREKDIIYDMILKENVFVLMKPEKKLEKELKKIGKMDVIIIILKN